ncbi:MAG: F0F1 ATP synthase subunit A [Bacteroidales bacterium]|nr:F0F1 ATP synthase subunit A [Bacteroidales bacterium]
MRGALVKILLCTVLLFAGMGLAGAAESQKIVPKDIVLGHVGDSYQWHLLTTAEGHHVSIYLPVILHSRGTGWHIFSSRHLYGHGEGEYPEYEGFRIASEGQYKDKIVETGPGGEEIRPLDLSLTKTAAGILINSAVLIIIMLVCIRYYRRHEAVDYAPKGFVGLVEWLSNSILEGVIIPCVGENYRKFAPFLLTVFFFIFVNNLMGLIPFFPGGANVTGNIAVTFILALSTFLVVNIFGTKEYYKEIFWPDVPMFLKAIPLMPLIEFVGMFTKPFALMVRLFANILAGHSIILSLTCIIFISAQMGAGMCAGMSAVSVFFMIFMNLIELLVAFLQAYVFTMLSSVFIGMAQVRHEAHE